MRYVCLIGILLAAGCAPSRLDSGEDEVDGGTPPPGTRCDADTACPSGRRCIDGMCLPDNGTCLTDNDCENDTFCACPPDIQAAQCACLPWGRKPKGDHDGMCSGQGFAPGEFKPPVLKCQWPPAGVDPALRDVLTTPIVIDLDKDGLPEVVFVGGYFGTTHLIAISGKDCAVKFDRAVTITGCTQLAAADLDGDGFPEIVAQAPGTAVYDHNGMLKVALGTPASQSCNRDYPPIIVDVDGVGPPEIVSGGQVTRYVATPSPHLDILWSVTPTGGTWGTVSVAADLDGDGKPEIITGTQVLDGITGADKSKPILGGLRGGYPAIGDFNLDGHPDIVLVSSARPGSGGQTVQVIDYTNNSFIMPPTTVGSGWGGPPTVADFDGDGKPEFATASATYYYVYKPDCLKTPKPATCLGSDAGVLWQSRNQDTSSGSTGSSVFDFNGDKVAEVIYRDECWLRVYNGPDGRKLFAAPVTSGTDLEMPVIADTDGDGHADIVVSSTTVPMGYCDNAQSGMELGIKHPGSTQGVMIYMDPMNRWMPSRSIWNQHAYDITNVNDDGTVPSRELPNWPTYNNFRQNVQGMGLGSAPVGDATGAIIIAPDQGDCVTVRRLYANICNRGSAPLSSGVPGSFYEGDPRKLGRLVCTGRAALPIAVGKCAPVSCDWSMPPAGAHDLWFRADDDGKGGRPAVQCKDGNDLAHLGEGGCSTIPG
jgi:hypothetical protein